MRFSTTIDQPALTVKLDNGMSVTIYDGGDVRVTQASRDVPGGIDMGGEYEFTLPDVSEIAGRCDQRDADPDSDDFPGSGKSTIEVTHRH